MGDLLTVNKFQSWVSTSILITIIIIATWHENVKYKKINKTQPGNMLHGCPLNRSSSNSMIGQSYIYIIDTEQNLNILILNRTWAYWYWTKPEHIDTEQNLNKLILNRTWAYWYWTEPEHIDTVQNLSILNIIDAVQNLNILILNRTWTYWYWTEPEHIDTVQNLNILILNRTWTYWYFPEPEDIDTK